VPSGKSANKTTTRRKTAARRTPVEVIKHKVKRANIPTEELRDFVADEEKAPHMLLYPRDPSLDPQLVWKGKDEQDRQPLAVPAVPIYIQEKIHPQAIVEQVRAQARREQPESQVALFGDFNGLSFQDLIDFYRHEQSWTNRMILGDSLLVMTSLAEKEGLKGKVQMIYMDPPYGIKFGSNWQVSTRRRDVRDGSPRDTAREPEVIKAFRDTWRLGIHSYLAYMRDRLVIAREMLCETGSLFVQIGDENVHLVRVLLDEVFGPENSVSTISFAKTTGFSGNYISSVTDSILWYAKAAGSLKFRPIWMEKAAGDEGASKYRPLHTIKALQGSAYDGERLATSDQLTSQGALLTSEQEIEFAGKRWLPPAGLHWKTTVGGMRRLCRAGRVFVEGESLRYVRFLEDLPVFPATNIWLEIGGVQSRTDPKIYVVQTATEAVKRCVLMTTDPGDLVLDPTCGSGTTAYVAEQWGRRWITIDTSRVAIALARTRLMAARFPFYLLADSTDGLIKEAEMSGHIPPAPLPRTESDVRRGFVYKRVPHISLKSIANNEEIDEIHARFQGRLEPLRAKINEHYSAKWEEWQVPRELPPTPAKRGDGGGAALLQEYWILRCDRQAEIDASIVRRADVELLNDKPYEDYKRIRVAGPFTVESLSPHRMLSTDIERPATEREAERQTGPGQFETLILENLRTAGVQNTVKKERLKFERLEPYAGTWIQGVGEYTENGKARRVAVAIGPEHGTVGAELVKEAAKEAVQGVGFDLLIVAGFAFDPHVSEEAKRYGKLVVLPTRINPDLQMGDELLKKTGAGNLFMVFGEPDVRIDRRRDGKVVVEIKGVDVYDPTTGEIRSNTTDDIACWFIDSDYNDESFFVRHAYFTGAGEPYEQLKRALRAEVNEAAWSALYSTKSYPFDPPSTGKIAVKVINHYGDEVLKVYEIAKI
jgi:adenine-specific DNA-methyltransferase